MKPTPKYGWTVVHLKSGTIVLSGLCKTDAKKIASQMPGCYAKGQ